MSFTDEDLKRLKGFIEVDDFYNAEGSRYMRPLVKALLSRLEAAEELIDAHHRLHEKNLPYPEYVADMFKAWCEAAGK